MVFISTEVYITKLTIENKIYIHSMHKS